MEPLTDIEKELIQGATDDLRVMIDSTKKNHLIMPEDLFDLIKYKSGHSRKILTDRLKDEPSIIKNLDRAVTLSKTAKIEDYLDIEAGQDADVNSASGNNLDLDAFLTAYLGLESVRNRIVSTFDELIDDNVENNPAISHADGGMIDIVGFRYNAVGPVLDSSTFKPRFSIKLFIDIEFKLVTNPNIEDDSVQKALEQQKNEITNAFTKAGGE